MQTVILNNGLLTVSCNKAEKKEIQVAQKNRRRHRERLRFSTFKPFQVKRVSRAVQGGAVVVCC